MEHAVEVRIPTFKRNDLLTRALTSLREQSHKNWRAIILDDSDAGDAEILAKQFRDERIIYEKNPKNLGKAANIDKAFKTAAYTQADYAFVLEDDNVLYPEFIKDNLSVSLQSGCPIVLCDQEYWIQDGDNYYKTADSILTPWYEEGQHSPQDLWTRLIFNSGISNGSLFWRTDAQTNLQVGEAVTDSNVQENLRCLKIRDKVYFNKKSLAKYTYFPRARQKPWPRLKRIKYTATKMAILKVAAENVGASFFEVSRKIACDTKMLKHWEEYAARLGCFKWKWENLSEKQAKNLYFKELIRQILFNNIYQDIKKIIRN